MTSRMRICGLVCVSCGDDYESSILGYIQNPETHELLGMKVRCKKCKYSWNAPTWGDGELDVEMITVPRE